MNVKLLEIRDEGTFIPAFAMLMESDNDAEGWLLRRAGYTGPRCILVGRIGGGGKAEYDPYDWGNRTMFGAHLYIIEHWDELTSGDVVDARVRLGEATQAVASERFITGAPIT